jgi:hypothetical protein
MVLWTACNRVGFASGAMMKIDRRDTHIHAPHLHAPHSLHSPETQNLTLS